MAAKIRVLRDIAMPKARLAIMSMVQSGAFRIPKG
jgi:hypothetical protein